MTAYGGSGETFLVEDLLFRSVVAVFLLIPLMILARVNIIEAGFYILLSSALQSYFNSVEMCKFSSWGLGGRGILQY